MVSPFWFTATTLIAIPLLSAQVQAPDTVRNFRPDTSTEASSAIQPKPKVSAEMKGDIFMARKMYREAVEAYAEAGNSAILSNKIGIAYHQMLNLDTAKKYYEKAIKTNPKYAEAINNLGTIYYARKSYRRALNQYRKALTIDNSASIFSNLGSAYFARKDYPHAAEAWQQALALDPEVFEHRGGQGVLLQEKSVEEKAKFDYYMAKLYAKAGANDRALQYIRKALEDGFKERNKFSEEPEFAGLKNLPEFKELITLEPRVL